MRIVEAENWEALILLGESAKTLSLEGKEHEDFTNILLAALENVGNHAGLGAEQAADLKRLA